MYSYVHSKEEKGYVRRVTQSKNYHKVNEFCKGSTEVVYFSISTDYVLSMGSVIKQL